MTLFQVVFTGALDLEGCAVAVPSSLRHRNGLASTEVEAGQGLVGRHDVFDSAGDDHVAAVLSGAGPQVYDEVGGAHDRLVVFHHDYGVAQVTQMVEGADEPIIVEGVQADGGFVADV